MDSNQRLSFVAGAVLGAAVAYSMSSSSSIQPIGEQPSSSQTPKKETTDNTAPSLEIKHNPLVSTKPIKARSTTIPQIICRAEQCFPSAIATISATGEKKTYSEFSQRTRQFAAAIRVDLGCEAGDRIAVLSLNCPDISWAGAIIVPLNTRLAIPELADVLNDCQAKVLISDETFLKPMEDLTKLVPTLTKCLVFGSTTGSTTVKSYENLISKNKPSPQPTEVDPESTYGLFYTGGTTGKSKGVMLSHQGLITNAYAIVNAVRYQFGCRYLHAGPMFHLADGASTFGVTLVGATHVFVPRFAPDGVLRAIQDHKVTHTLLVPTMFQMLLQQPNVKSFDLRSVRYFIYGASPMPEPTLLESMKTFPGAKFIQGYREKGMTEASPCLTFLGSDHHFAGSPLLSSVGQVVPHGDLRIFDENEQEVPRGTVGEIVYRGANVMLGYWNMPKSTEAALKNGWLHTGDGGKMDANGYVWVVDRIKDMIVSGGENVYSSEVESAVAQIKGVIAVAVIGVPDKVLVEKVCAIVVVAQGNPDKVTEDKITEHCKLKIAGYKCPKLVVVRTDPLPLSGAGKVLKSELRKPFWVEEKAQIYAKTDDRVTSYDNQKGQ